MPQQPPHQNVPDGWDVVETSTAPGGGVPDGWEVVEDANKPSGAGALATGAGLATLAAGTAASVMPMVRNGIQDGVTRLATAPGLASAAGKLAGRVAAPLNIVKQGYDVLSGKQSAFDAAKDALVNEGARRFFRPERLVRAGVKLAQRAALPVAEAMEGGAMAAPLAIPLAGGLAGLAGTAGFLGALQHDANRKVTIDYSKNTPDTAIARMFSNMRDSEKNRGKTLAERQDDPNDVMFQPDDSETVRGGAAPSSDVSSVVQRFFGRR